MKTRVLALFALLVTPLLGANYILEFNTQASVPLLASKYGFQVVRPLSTQSAVISALNPLPVATLQALRAETGVVEVETDSELNSSESDGSSRAAVTLESLIDILSGFFFFFTVSEDSFYVYYFL